MDNNATGNLTRASLSDTLSVLADIVLPNLAKGVIIRRPTVVGLAERLNIEKRSVRTMQKLRDKYGSGPLILRIPNRTQALILDPTDVKHVLEGTPEPFATATKEKEAALDHFQPQGVLVSHGEKRAERRRFNEEVLDTRHPMHRHARQFANVILEEAKDLLARVDRENQKLDWAQFEHAWFRIVRRVVLGDRAADDQELTSLINKLRGQANWAFLSPKRKGLRDRFYQRLTHYLEAPQPDCLAEIIARMPPSAGREDPQQVPQWLFAFDPAGMATFRTLALLASHPEALARAKAEIAASLDESAQPAELSFLRCCVLESLRLWPTSPVILRESTEAVTWKDGILPRGSSVVIFSPFFHRDDEHMNAANSFNPDLWSATEPEPKIPWPLIPFSEGPGMCPGRHLVMLVASTMLSALLMDRQPTMAEPFRLDRSKPLPATLNNFSLQFRMPKKV